MKQMIQNVIDKIMGHPAVPAPHGDIADFTVPNRKQKRVGAAMHLKRLAAPRRKKFEKRGAPGRASKGRRPGLKSRRP